MAKNRTGGLTGNKEWGNKARKNEDAERNRNNCSRIEAITDQVVERFRATRSEPVKCFYCDGTGVSADDVTPCGFCEGGIHTLGT